MSKYLTKEWRENYWYHYKWHTIAGIFILMLLLITLKDCTSRVVSDLSVLYVTDHQMLTTEEQEELKAFLQPLAEDVNGDGEVNIILTPMAIPETPQSEMDMGMQQRFMVELAAGESTLYLFDERYKDVIEGHEMLMTLPNGETGASLSNFFGQEGMYVGVRVLRNAEKDDEEALARHENALNVWEKVAEQYN